MSEELQQFIDAHGGDRNSVRNKVWEALNNDLDACIKPWYEEFTEHPTDRDPITDYSYLYEWLGKKSDEGSASAHRVAGLAALAIQRLAHIQAGSQ